MVLSFRGKCEIFFSYFDTEIYGFSFSRFADYIGHQEVPDFDALAARTNGPTTSTAVPGSRKYNSAIVPAPLSTAEVHIYTPEDEHGPGLKKGHDGFVEYKPVSTVFLINGFDNHKFYFS